MMNELDKIKLELDHLAGMKPDEIAEFLIIRGHRGRPCNADLCPIARYFKTINGSVLVGHNKLYTVLEERPEFEKVDLPESVKLFIGEFDDGRYPELVASYDEVWS